MGAFISGRRTTAVVASGVVLGVTALTGGVIPAGAKPGAEPGTPTTTMAEPEAPHTAAPTTTVEEVPAQAPPSPSAPTEQPVPEAPAPAAPPSGAERRGPGHGHTESAEGGTSAARPTPAALGESAAEPASPAAPAVEPASPAAPTTAAEPVPTTTAVPTTTSVPTTTAEPVPTTTAVPTTTTGPLRPAPAAAQTPGSGAPVPSAAVHDAAVADAATQARSAPTSVPQVSGVDPTPDGATPAGRSTAGAATMPSPIAATEPVREVSAPQTLQAPEPDVALAKSVKPIELKPDPASENEIAELAKVIDLAPPGGPTGTAPAEGARVVQASSIVWDRNVRQWSPEWVRYDDYYRPVIANPYRDPVRIVYMYQNAPRVVMIPPLQSVVMEMAQLAAYSFTAVVVNAVNTVVNVAVGSFFGGGFIPAVGMPLPPPPAPVLRYDNVPVQVRYASATYEPFVVRQIVDVGDDPQYGGHKALLDGVTPVWGQWVQNPAGQRQFEVYRTQQFPGLDAPAQAPLPGDYRLRLAADTVGTESDETNKYLAIAAVTAAGLSLGLVGLSLYLGRRRPQL